MKCRILASLLMVVVTAGLTWGQRPPRPDNPPPPPRPRQQQPRGKWWDRPEMAAKLGLTTDQRKRMDDAFQQVRVRLIDLKATLDKEEAVMEPMMQAAQPDDAKILPQIDRVAQARAELEKAEARLMLALRHVLTPEQWDMLQSESRPPKPPRE